jgi:hypothetical protein
MFFALDILNVPSFWMFPSIIMIFMKIEMALQLFVISNLTKFVQQFLNCNMQMAGGTDRHADMISLICIEFMSCRECIISMQGLLSFVSRNYMYDRPSIDHFGSSMLAQLVCFLVYLGGDWLKSRLRHRLSWMKIFVVFLSPSMQLLG